MKKFICILLVIVAISSFCSIAGAETVDAGILTYLGTTEDEFQESLDDLRKAMAPLMRADDGFYDEDEDWSSYGVLEVFMSALVRDRRVVHFYDSLLSMQMALRSRKVDEVILPEVVGLYLVRNNPLYDILFSLNMMPSTISFGFRQGDTKIQGEFNKAIAAMKKDGTLKKLESQYLSEPFKEPTARIKFTTFKDAETIKVAVTGDLPPIDFIAADGTPTGYNTAILSEIGKRLKKNIRLISVEAGGRCAALASERADVVFWYRNTEGLKTPTKYRGKNLGGVMKDSYSSVILSDPYYEWDTDLVIGLAE